jgi:hypothetical protein
VLVAGTALLRLVAESTHLPSPDAGFDVPPLPAGVLKPLSSGFSNLVADACFLEAVQLYAGRPRRATAGSWAQGDARLARLLDYATDLDPLFAEAYRFAGDALPRETTDGKVAGVRAAIGILKKGVAAGVEDWLVAFDLGYLEMHYIGDSEAATSAFAEATTRGAPPFVGELAGRIRRERIPPSGLEVQ